MWELLDSLMALPMFRAGFIVGALVVSGWLSWRAYRAAQWEQGNAEMQRRRNEQHDLWGGQGPW